MKIDLQGRTKLAYFQDLYNEARTFSDEMYEKLDQHLKQYKGDKKIDGSETEATQVRNITYELVESQVTSYLPSIRLFTLSQATVCPSTEETVARRPVPSP